MAVSLARHRHEVRVSSAARVGQSDAVAAGGVGLGPAGRPPGSTVDPPPSQVCTAIPAVCSPSGSSPVARRRVEQGRQLRQPGVVSDQEDGGRVGVGRPDHGQQARARRRRRSPRHTAPAVPRPAPARRRARSPWSAGTASTAPGRAVGRRGEPGARRRGVGLPAWVSGRSRSDAPRVGRLGVAQDHQRASASRRPSWHLAGGGLRGPASRGPFMARIRVDPSARRRAPARTAGSGVQGEVERDVVAERRDQGAGVEELVVAEVVRPRVGSAQRVEDRADLYAAPPTMSSTSAVTPPRCRMSGSTETATQPSAR